MKKLFLFCSFLILFAHNFASSQRWTFKSIDNSFDGKIKSSSIIGYGDKFPYNKPILVVNYFPKDQSLNLYISGSGYFIENTRVSVQFIFDKESDKIYSSNNHSFSKDGEIIFLNEFSFMENSNKISKIEFIHKLKKSNNLDVRIMHDYGKNDIEFSLSGSSRAIDFVLPIKIQEKLLTRAKKTDKEIREEDAVIKISEIIKKHKLSSSDSVLVINKIMELKDYFNIDFEVVDNIKFDKFSEGFKVRLIDSNGIEIAELPSLLNLEFNN